MRLSDMRAADWRRPVVLTNFTGTPGLFERLLDFREWMDFGSPEVQVGDRNSLVASREHT